MLPAQNAGHKILTVDSEGPMMLVANFTSNFTFQNIRGLEPAMASKQKKRLSLNDISTSRVCPMSS
jgi:hypothetical protein